MNSSISYIAHYSSVITGEIVSALILAIILFAMLTYREKRKSSMYLFIAMAMQVLFLLGDAASFFNLSIRTLPIGLMRITYFVSYTFGILVLIPFTLYSKAFIEEKTSVKKWTYRIPVILGLLDFIISVVAIFSGSVYGVVDGKMAETGGAPVIVSLLQLAAILYLPIVAFTKKKQIGFKAVMLLGLFGILPATLIFVSYDYTGSGAALALAIVYVLLQCDYSAEREKRRKQLEELNQQLTDANEENVAQIEEITALNTQLQDNQSMLEESSAEQEAQLEEITALNLQLEENQTRLEELSAEQESQIEEISALNMQLQEQSMELQEARKAADTANDAKTAFLFNMSHDIRTPMNAIIGFRDLLEKHQDEPEKRADYLCKIEESSNVLLSIINNVLEMARIEKGTIEIDETAWSAEQFNDTLYSIFHEMMKEKGIEFTRQIVVQNPYVYCDPIKLREVFINILSNAYKYTNPGGSVNMHLEEIPSDREGYAMYQTTITDNGIGMSEEFLPHIFEEFSRENNTTDNKVEGTGLGMPIVKRLIEFMDGTIEVRSIKGEGSTFVVTIPHKIADRSSLVDHDGVVVDPKLFEGKRVLLAEDNEFNAEIAIEMLEEAGFIVELAEDGSICCDMLSCAADGYYDLILMDIQMPNMNGYEATKIIRKMPNSVKADIPIIAMTANAFEEDKREALKVGMNGHIAKPVRASQLMKILAGIVG